MNPDLDRLIQLQAAESELKKTDALLADIPRRRASMETEPAAERARLDAAKTSLDLSQKTRRQKEVEVQDLEGKRSKYKGQLMEVKTNKEYTAMLHEIEGVEREIRTREDQILAEMEKAVGLGAEVKREEELFKRDEVSHKQQLAALDAEGKALEERRQTLGRERDEVAATVSPDLLELFHRVARLRGVAVAEAREGMCQECHLKLRLQQYAEIKHNDEIVQCPACNRILWYDPPPPVAAAEP